MGHVLQTLSVSSGGLEFLTSPRLLCGPWVQTVALELVPSSAPGLWAPGCCWAREAAHGQRSDPCFHSGKWMSVLGADSRHVTPFSLRSSVCALPAGLEGLTPFNMNSLCVLDYLSQAGGCGRQAVRFSAQRHLRLTVLTGLLGAGCGGRSPSSPPSRRMAGSPG